MNKHLIATALIVAGLSTAAATCRGPTKAEAFVNAINAASNGAATVYLTKDPTLAKKYIIVYENGQYYAVKSWGNLHFFRNDEDAYAYYLSNRLSVTPDVNGYFIGQNGVLYEATPSDTADLEKAGALEQGIQLTRMSEYVASQYGLSEDRARDVARMVRTWKQVTQSRGVTRADWDSLSSGLLGIGLDRAEAAYDAYSTGNHAEMDALIQKAAQTNGVSPEHMRALTDDLMKD